ncbi:LOW QUALITY PROTEIN: interferon-related developmental regulator 1-like [Pomacea canaliculata]|uniref:LOW QUALITY PROTEIN: interferon-related developmental regulator 1-like n=1 Tax=Pomacea canaliculata TaxID=400727 RepID=UPI000D738D04|nr:LOW QUALITY PROTEIN: interferon-related developmental regulator 1-like [Pomacea canaliculata]
MPKVNRKRGTQKKAQGVGTGLGSRPATDDENSTGDNWSTVSVASDDSSWCESASVADEQEIEDTTEQENFEDRLAECIEGIASKSGPQRNKFLEGLRKAFSKKYIAEFLDKRKETVSDSLLRCVRKGKSDEVVLAAICLSLLAVQLGEELSPQYPNIQAVLTTVMTDKSASVKARAECATTLAMCCFLATDDFEDTQTIMSSLEDIFSQCYRKGDGTMPQMNPDLSLLHNRCLAAWSLLVTTSPPFFVEKLAMTHISLLGDLLHSSDTELRITAGEAIALLYDMSRCIDENFGGDDEATQRLCVQLKELSTESTKHMAKKDRRTQRSCFRDILRTVEAGEVPEATIRMGIESLVVEGWQLKKHYDAFCQVLGSGINIHLQENVMLRDFFNLGPPLPVGAKPTQKLSKVERNFHNNVANKARTKARARSRDKRSVVIGF